MRKPPLSRSFRLFWLGQTASNLGDAFGFVAMPLLVFELTHSVLQMGYVTAITAVGQLFAATFSGVVVDRVNRRKLMVLCDLTRLVLYGLLPVASWFHTTSVTLVYLVAGLTAIASNLFLVAYMAAVSNLVAGDAVAAANSRLQASQALTYVIGSLTAGAVVSVLGPSIAMGFDALSFAASAASLLAIRFRQDRAIRGAEASGYWADLIGGFSYLARQPLLRALVLFQTCIALFGSIGLGAAVIDLIIYRLKVDFGQASFTVGLSLAFAATGAVIGALLASKAKARMSFGLGVLIGTATQALGLLTCGFNGGVVALVIGGAFWSAGLTFRAVAATSLRQQTAPDQLLGRVVAAGWVVIFSASALGATLLTHLAAAFGAGPTMLVTGAALAILSLLGLATPLARGTTAVR